MNIGIVTTWFERGAAYVSRSYMNLLEKENDSVFIYARGGEQQAQKDDNWNLPNVTWNGKLNTFKISIRSLLKWIKTNKIEIILFNEQQDFRILAKIKKYSPETIIGAYIDYYTEKLLPLYNIYDFVICNTKRHMQAMSHFEQKFYVKWGTDIKLFNAENHKKNDKITFFHSVGMSPRKGTDILLNAFINGRLYEKSKLIIHTQIPIEKVCGYSDEILKNYGIEVVQKTVSAPGLYYLGDVYVYPTRLDGLGLTMYEALASGLPVITTDYPPMNEVVDDNVGKLVKLERNYCRWDAYYWPMSICDENDLISKMSFYIDNPDIVEEHRVNARRKAELEYNLDDRSKEVHDIFTNVSINKKSFNYISVIEKFYRTKSVLYRMLSLARRIVGIN